MAKNDLFESALAAEGISGKLADVARSIYMQESGGGRNTRTSNAGAMGGMQIMPKTFAGVADKGWDIDDPMHNARAGIRYLKQLDKQAGGDPALTAAGYYGGPGGLEKARRGIPVYDPRNPDAPNTLQYGAQVAARLSGGKGGGSNVPAAPGNSAPVNPLAQSDQHFMNMGPQSDAELTAQYQMHFQPAGDAPLPQLAQAPVEPMAAINANPNEVDAWTKLRQAMPRKVQPDDLNFGQDMPGVPGAPGSGAIAVPQFATAAVGTRPDFRLFSALNALSGTRGRG